MRSLRAFITMLVIVVLGFLAWNGYIEPELDGESTTKPTASPSRSSITAAPPVKPAKGVTVTSFRKASRLLNVVPEDRQAYLRSYFGKGWIDADKDCRDTRQEVLARESLVPVTKGCKIYLGKWLSYYDNKTWTKSFQVQIDHLVPLAEAWDSGAYQWTKATRIRFANDLKEKRGLVPTTSDLNYDKVADDPQWYVPKVNKCKYIASWIAVKARWSMTVDQREKEAIDRVMKGCPDRKLTITRAKIGLLPFAAGTGTTNRNVTIDSIIYSGKSEKIILHNTGNSPAKLIGWVVRDEIGYGQYRMPKTVIPARGTLTILSSEGRSRVDAAGNPVQHANWGDVWNNSGDTATLIDGKRKVADICRYRGDNTGKALC
ncbi:lamin tail domain-containing protein [Aeromicrobium sp.]|uniref:lamin tail domain-containing protein n=1 Tax=Aeromicrobium sp. TaxID=1871063 RepID=UPI002FCBF072